MLMTMPALGFALRLRHGGTHKLQFCQHHTVRSSHQDKISLLLDDMISQFCSVGNRYRATLTDSFLV